MAPPQLFSLPQELRASFVQQFFDTDDRPSILLETEPTAIFPTYATIKHWFGNQAYKSCGADKGFELKEIVEAFDQGNANGRGSRTAVCKGKKWGLRSLDQQWWALVCTGVAEREDSETNGTKSSGKTNGHEQPDNTKFGPGTQLDWTRHDVPNLSPWIEMVRNFDWASSGVGPMEKWNDDLRSHVISIMYNTMPRLLVWGNDQVFIYNEACVPLFGEKHPRAFGRPVYETWLEAWDIIGPLMQDAYSGNVVSLQRMPVQMNRHGFMEDTFWDFTMLPIVGADGVTVGIADELFESTLLTRTDRRRTSLLKTSRHISSAGTIEDLWSKYSEALSQSVEDVALGLLYSVQDCDDDGDVTMSNSKSNSARGQKCVLQGTVGVSENDSRVVRMFNLRDDQEQDASDIVAACLKAWKTRDIVSLSSKDGNLPKILTTCSPDRGGGADVRNVIVAPILSHLSHDVLAIVIVALDPRVPYDDEYGLWTSLLFDILGKGASLVSLPEEQRRVQKIADDINSRLAQQLQMAALQAEKSEEKFTRMAASAPVGMFVFDAAGAPLYLNDTYKEMLGKNREEHAAHPKTEWDDSWEDYIHPDDLERFHNTWDSIMENKLPINIEYRLKKPWKSIDKNTGNELVGESWLLANVFPELDANGKVTTIQGWLTDISHNKFSENLLSQRLADALENKVRTENFIDMTSHEMRNPLSAILQSADSIISVLETSSILNLDGTPESPTSHAVATEIVDAAETIILCAQHQKRIVDDILTLSKLDASLLVISPDTVQPPTLIMKALKMYEAEIVRADIQTQVNIEPSYSELGVDWVVLDSSRLLQVIINLLTNSIKFTNGAEKREITICIGASRERPTGKHHGVDFVPNRHAEKPAPSDSQWGTGEQLYLQVAVSDTGRGLSEDEMKLLFQRFTQASPRTYKQYGGSGLGLFISRELCELQGGQIGVASKNGKTSFTFFVRTRKWVEDPNSENSRLTLSRFTSNSASPIAFFRRGSEIVKPSSLVSRETQSSAGASPARLDNGEWGTISAKTQTPYTVDYDPSLHEDDLLHVLIVEDNLINQRVMSQQLMRAGCRVHVANHGLECLEFLDRSTFCTSDGTPIPLSLVLLDLEMPTMDGMTCIRHIRQRQQDGKILGHVPVIAVTANARSEQIKVAIDAGMDRVVTKPFRIPELIPQMEELLAEINRGRHMKMED